MAGNATRIAPDERRRLKTSRKREEILRSAAAAFARKGYHGTSLDEIADKLLMTKGSLYYYFRDKEDILFACHDYSLNLVLENLARVQAMKASADKKLAELVKGHVGVMLDALQGSAMALDFTALSDERLAAIIAKRDRFEQGLRAIVRQGVREGVFAPTDAKLAAFMVLGAINWIAKWYRPGGNYDAEAIGGYFGKTFIAGLREERVSRKDAKAQRR